MSRFGLILGLIVSVAAHAALLAGRATEPVAAERESASAARRAVEVVSLPSVTEAPAPVEADEPEKPDELVKPVEPESRNDPAVAASPAPEPARPSDTADDRVSSSHAAAPPAPTAPPLSTTTRVLGAESTDSGDFAGSSSGVPSPRLRIDWGSPAHARRVLATGGMRLVVAEVSDGSVSIERELIPASAGWRQRRFESNVRHRYANHLRIVDDVPAFADAARLVQPTSTRRLAVLLPRELDRRLQSAQLAAAFERGLTLARIDSFGGRFVLAGEELAFEITRVRTRSATP